MASSDHIATFILLFGTVGAVVIAVLGITSHDVFWTALGAGATGFLGRSVLA